MPAGNDPVPEGVAPIRAFLVRQVFRLVLRFPAFPKQNFSGAQGEPFSPSCGEGLTAAGPFPFHTGFPIKSRRTPDMGAGYEQNIVLSIKGLTIPGDNASESSRPRG